jgi:N-acetylmuramidase-like protein/SH3 domain-containing protein/peptidase C39-like protein
MAFQLVHLSQQDPKWKTDTLGFGDPGDTIGYVGCALTATAMLISGHGYPETPKTLNQKLRNVNGFAGSGIAWGAVSKLYPQINVRSTGLLNNTDAPLKEIDASLAAGQPVVVLIDYAPDADLDWHYVLIYEKRDNDYMILDPWPLNEPNGVLLMSRFGHKRPLKRAIFQAVFFQCTAPGDGSSIPPSSTTTTPASTPSTPAVETNFFVEVQPMEAPGLRLRAQPNTNPDSVTLAMEPGGTQLRVIEAEAGARQKVGQLDQWIRVRDPNGLEGYVAAWFVMLPVSSTPGDTPTDVEPSGGTSAINRSRPSIGDGLENVPLEAPADQRINSNSLLARIWNKYGGLLAPIAEKMNFDPAIAVAILAQESGGQPYGADGRLIIRFENHLFYEYWGKRNVSAYNNHFQTGSPAWTGHKWRAKANTPWRNCHTSQGVEWDVFALASKLDDGAAKKSISMGLSQVLGSNFGILGFASVQDMFNAFVAHERNQVVAFFDFLQGNGPTATNALKTRDFRTIASIYNGAGNADYYGKLIGSHYTTFIALRGIQPPVSSTPTTTPPSTSTGGAYARVKADATLGLNLRSSMDTSGMANVVATLPAGTQLLILDENGAAKVGVMNQWIRVREPGGREGFVAAWHLEKVEAATPPVETEPGSGPVEEAPASPSTTVPEKLQVMVKAGGTKIYSSASTSSMVVATEKAGARLTVLETAEGAQAKIGIKGKRINVKATNNKRGYVGAESVKLP